MLKHCLKCGQLTDSGSYCRAHRPRQRQAQRWKKVRAQVLARDGYRCKICGAPATEVDHIQAVQDNGPDHPDNAQPLCHRHHVQKHRETR
ncbi:MAG: HNH endonuclease [Solirubrobacterales bacterium]|nr:HNH endonuclease [Solirubrobacterales bacterium]